MATVQHKIFVCVCDFIKIESATAVQRAFRLHFNIQPPMRKSICRWNHQFEQIRAVCVKAKAPADHVYQRRTWDELKRVLSVAHASQPSIAVSLSSMSGTSSWTARSSKMRTLRALETTKDTRPMTCHIPKDLHPLQHFTENLKSRQLCPTSVQVTTCQP